MLKNTQNRKLQKIALQCPFNNGLGVERIDKKPMGNKDSNTLQLK